MIGILEKQAISAVEDLYGSKVEMNLIQVEKTNPAFEGDYTLVVFPLLRISKKSPLDTATEIGNYIVRVNSDLDSFNVVKGFLNLKIKDLYWLHFFNESIHDMNFGFTPTVPSKPILVEYSSPNTNKPLHLGHIRNNLLGYSIAEILKANGHKVIKLNLVNDRGIHICKSMLAWMKWGDGETPESSGMKGDHLVGKYYVLFDQKHKEEIAAFVHRGFTDDEAYSKSPLMKEAQGILQKWESADEEIITVWRLMNGWAIDGFNVTYERLGVDFDQVNYESKVYLHGKEIILEGLKNGAFFQKDDSSVWADLTIEGLDEKLLLRSDGTSVYITQDIGTAQRRFDEYAPEKMIYIVGNEQIYHFDVLKKVLHKLNRPWSDKILHLSYGMVELPHGRMKSREGTVVDADDLMDEMFETAMKTTEELGKSQDFIEKEKQSLYNMISLGALKYYMLKVDPKKNMLFNPEESIDFNGNTGPFVQYTYARIQSIFRKAEKEPEAFIREFNASEVTMLAAEKELVKLIYEFPHVIKLAGENLNPALIANYCFDLVKSYNHYYQETPILKRIEPAVANFRVALSWFAASVIKKSMLLLGIDVPDKM
jgi:arginyl-tRNA synthetase